MELVSALVSTDYGRHKLTEDINLSFPALLKKSIIKRRKCTKLPYQKVFNIVCAVIYASKQRSITTIYTNILE
jgi:hypothetical protein